MTGYALGRMIARLRRLLGLRPVLRIHVMAGNELSEFVARAMRRDAEARGYRVKEHRM